MSIRKIMVAAWVALGAGWALADAPSVTEVNMTQLADKTVVITYKLANGPAVVTFDIEADGVSIGGRNLQAVSADSEVFKKVSGSSADVHTIRWSPTVDWQDRVLPANGVRAVVKAWALDDKPDYMVVHLGDLVAVLHVEEHSLAERQRGRVIFRKVDARDSLALRDLVEHFLQNFLVVGHCRASFAFKIKRMIP